MEVQLTQDQKAFIRVAVETGRLTREEDAVREALELWEARERLRAELLASIDKAETTRLKSQARIITEDSMAELANQVKQRGRARLAAEAASNQ